MLNQTVDLAQNG